MATDRDRERAQTVVAARWQADGMDGLVNIPALVDAVADSYAALRESVVATYEALGHAKPEAVE